MWRNIGIFLLIVFGIAYCNNMREEHAQEVLIQKEDAMADYITDHSDEIQKQEESQLETETYQDSFGSTDCTYDCSGHDAGFAWAASHGITDPLECSGKSLSFVEGCEAYTQELQTRIDERKQELEDNIEDIEE